MYTTRHVENLHIGGQAAITTADYASGLNNSEIGIFTPEGVRMTEASALTESRFMVASKNASGVIYTSPVYSKAAIKSASLATYAAATQQLDYLGYNGTTGSIDAINSNLYKINIQVQEMLRSNTDGRKVKFGVYQSDASATQAEIAIGLVGSLVDNFDREPEKFMTFKAINNEAVTAGNAFDGDATVTKGSKVFSVLTNTLYGGVQAVVGDFVRLGTAAGIPGTTVTTSDVYRITGISGLNITVDRPIQVTSGTYTAAGAHAEVLTAAEGLAADWGIALTGAAVDFEAGKLNNEVVRWDVQLVDFGTTTDATKTTAASKGSGTVNEIAQLEWFVSGFDGEYFREGFSYIHSSRSNTDASVAGGGYDIIRLTFDESSVVGFQGQVSPMVLTLAIPATPGANSYAIGSETDDITDILEALAGTSIVAAGGLAIS